MTTKTYTSAADDAKAIRRELKKRWGYTSRDISVRSSSYSGGSSISITLKRAGICRTAVEKLARGIAESIRRCERTGEILSGTNRYVRVDWDDDLRRSVASIIRPKLEAAEPPESGYSKPIAIGAGVTAWLRGDVYPPWRVGVDNDCTRSYEVHGPDAAASVAAAFLLEASNHAAAIAEAT